MRCAHQHSAQDHINRLALDVHCSGAQLDATLDRDPSPPPLAVNGALRRSQYLQQAFLVQRFVKNKTGARVETYPTLFVKAELAANSLSLRKHARREKNLVERKN